MGELFNGVEEDLRCKIYDEGHFGTIPQTSKNTLGKLKGLQNEKHEHFKL
jgi:hypothetical protein